MTTPTGSQPDDPRTGSPSGRRLSWDIIRTLAISAVVLHHSTYWGPVTRPGITAAPFAMPYQFGASALLVVSGYFAAETIRRYTGAGWWLRRMARLMPAYAVAVLAVFALAQAFTPDGWYKPTLGDAVGNLLLLQLWIPEVDFVDGSFWTLPVQVGAFTAIAILAGIRVIRGHRTMFVLWAVVLSPVLVRVMFMRQNPPDWLLIVMEGSGLHRAHLLAAGVGVWLWARRRISVPHLLAFLAGILLAQWVHPPMEDSIGGLAAMLVLICLAARGPDWDLPGLRAFARPVRWIAGISYGVYLVHQSIGYLIARTLSDLGVSPWWWLAAFIATAVLLGWALTAWVERPVFRLWHRSRAASAPA